MKAPQNQTLMSKAVYFLWAFLLSIIYFSFIKYSKLDGNFTAIFIVISLLSFIIIKGIFFILSLQEKNNLATNYEMRLNYTFNIIRFQSKVFNSRIDEFQFYNNDGRIINLEMAIKYYKENQTSNIKLIFIERNKEVIKEILPFICRSYSFIHDLIAKEKIDDHDKDLLLNIFYRNQNRAVKNLFEIIQISLQIEKSDYENITSLDIEKAVNKKNYEVRRDMLNWIIKNQKNETDIFY